MPFCHGFPGSMDALFDLFIDCPTQKGLADELGPVVRAHERRRPMQGHETRQDVDDATRANAASDIDGQTLSGPFVDDGQAFEPNESALPPTAQRHQRSIRELAGPGVLLGRPHLDDLLASGRTPLARLNKRPRALPCGPLIGRPGSRVSRARLKMHITCASDAYADRIPAKGAADARASSKSSLPGPELPIRPCR